MVRKWVKSTAVATILGVVATICISATKGDFQLGRNMEIFVNLMRVLYTQYVDEVDANTMLKNVGVFLCHVKRWKFLDNRRG